MIKIFANKFTQITNNSFKKNNFIKTKSYLSDSFQLHVNAQNDKMFSIKEFILSSLNRKKLNHKSFVTDSYAPKTVFSKSEKAIKISNKYAKTDCLMEYDKVIDGFRDGGSRAVFDKSGNCISENSKVVIVDRGADVYLSSVINYVKEKTLQMSENKKMKFLYNFISDISGNTPKKSVYPLEIAHSTAEKDQLIGKIFENECALCDHKAIMYKILADETGLQTRLIRGKWVGTDGLSKHVWNEVKLKDNKNYLVDMQNSQIVNLSSSKAHKNPKLIPYTNVFNESMYYVFD